VVVEERDDRRVPIGILTDRDIVIEVIAEKVDIEAVAIEDVMSFDLITVQEDDDIFDTIELMRTKGIRRVPSRQPGGIGRDSCGR
jgi:predicted transcriptional regulator